MLSTPAPTISYSNLCLLTSIFFIIGDLYFGYYDHTCTHSWVPQVKLGISLGTWLRVSGWTSLLFLIIPSVAMCLGRLGGGPLLRVYQVFAGLYSLFRLIWLILGSLIFWGYLSGTGACSNALNTYMWITLLFGWILLLLSCYSQQQTYVYASSQRTFAY